MSEIKIKVGDKEYDIPDLDVDHWVSIIERDEKRNEERSLFKAEGVKEQIEFFYDLLHPYHNEITRKVLGKMPMYQLSPLFVAKIMAELLQIPLDSDIEEESQPPSESSSKAASPSSPSASTGRPAKSAK